MLKNNIIYYTIFTKILFTHLENMYILDASIQISLGMKLVIDDSYLLYVHNYDVQ